MIEKIWVLKCALDILIYQLPKVDIEPQFQNIRES